MTSVLFLLKTDSYTLFGLIRRAMMYVLDGCACRFVFRSGSLDIVGGDTALLFMTIPLLDIVVA